jgi:ankyrin repeat protein
MNPEDPIYAACQQGDLEALQRWFPDDPTLWRGAWGYSLLHLVAQTSHLHVLDWLLTFLPNVNEPVSCGYTPLMWTCQYHQEAMARRLLVQGADLQMTDCLGRTALHWACAYRWMDGVALLLEYGADPDVRDHRERLPEDHLSVANPLHTLLAEARLGCGLK